MNHSSLSLSLSFAAATLLGALSSPLVAQDFNGDGVGELVIGVPYEDVDGLLDAGMVHVLHGEVTERLIVQAAAGGISGSEAEGRFGYASTHGDFNGDGYSDLAIGSPGATVSGQPKAGAVSILYGSSAGLLVDYPQVLHQDSYGVEGVAEYGDQFGFSLVTGDFDGNGVDDLAVGAPYEDASAWNNGVVHLFYGAFNAGLLGVGSLLYGQHESTVFGAAEDWDLFGWALASGDFDERGVDALVVGIPFEDIGSVQDAGGVWIKYHDSPLAPAKQEFWTQNTSGVVGVAETGDRFGFSLAAGQFKFVGFVEGDFADDLAIGIPGEAIGAIPEAGAVYVLSSFQGPLPSGLSTSRAEFLSGEGFYGDQMGEVAEAGDQFGTSLAAVLRSSGTAGLAIGVPKQDVNGVVDAGLVHLLAQDRLAQSLTLSFTQDSLFGGQSPAESGAWFGYALTGFGIPEPVPSGSGGSWQTLQNLAIGVPGQSFLTLPNAGAVDTIDLENRKRPSARVHWTQEQLGLDAPSQHDQLGSSLGD